MFPVLFENDDVLAIDKPEGLASIPGRPAGEDSLLSLLSAELSYKVFVVHRLDQEVSGVILFAKNAAAHKLLNEQFADRLVKKTYLALVHGSLETADGLIDRPMRHSAPAGWAWIYAEARIAALTFG